MNNLGGWQEFKEIVSEEHLDEIIAKKYKCSIEEITQKMWERFRKKEFPEFLGHLWDKRGIAWYRYSFETKNDLLRKNKLSKISHFLANQNSSIPLAELVDLYPDYAVPPSARRLKADPQEFYKMCIHKIIESGSIDAIADDYKQALDLDKVIVEHGIVTSARARVKNEVIEKFGSDNPCFAEKPYRFNAEYDPADGDLSLTFKGEGNLQEVMDFAMYFNGLQAPMALVQCWGKEFQDKTLPFKGFYMEEVESMMEEKIISSIASSLENALLAHKGDEEITEITKGIINRHAKEITAEYKEAFKDQPITYTLLFRTSNYGKGAISLVFSDKIVLDANLIAGPEMLMYYDRFVENIR